MKVDCSSDHEKSITVRARGFLVYDPRKCTGCHTCMLACSLAHEGSSSLATARIQIIEDRLPPSPSDIAIATCRQCNDSPCLNICPTEALQVDEAHMGIPIVDAEKCIGCGLCAKACRFSPSRIRIHPTGGIALKCDLCRDTPYWKHGSEEFACIQACPVRALSFTSRAPVGQSGFEVNLRGEGWGRLDLPTG
jgi:protein NrfC